MIPSIKVHHKGGFSVDLNNSLEIECNKHCTLWSKFYFYKKNFSLTTAYKNYFYLFGSLFKIFVFNFIDLRKCKIN